MSDFTPSTGCLTVSVNQSHIISIVVHNIKFSSWSTTAIDNPREEDSRLCQEMPIAPTTTKAKKAFSPIAGASATGKLANIPIAILPIPAIKQVVTNTTFGSICAAPRICGFTKTMYTMVKKVVIPAINSVRTVVPC